MSRYSRRGYKYYKRRKKRSGFLKGFLLTLFGLLLVFVGYSVSGPVIDFLKNPDSFKKPESQVESNVESSPSEDPVESRPTGGGEGGGELRAVYMPAAKLTGGQLEDFISRAKDAGINAVVINLKNKDGEVYYPSKVKGATLNGQVQLDLQSVTARLKQAGITPIAEMYCFLDRLMPYVDKDTAIMLEGGSGYRWLDNSAEKGGKPWLNPYSDAAAEYLTSLTGEIAGSGFEYVLLNGVQFPPKQMTKRADFGEKAQNMAKSDALVSFINKAKEAAAAKGGKVILAMSASASLGVDTTDYEGNPLDFGAEFSAPSLQPAEIPKKLTNGQEVIENPLEDVAAAVKMAAGQLVARVELAEKETKLVPFLQAHSLGAADVKAQWQALEEAGVKSYIFFNPDGVYDFGALKK